MEVLYGLHVSLSVGMRDMTRVQFLHLLQQLAGFRPEDEMYYMGPVVFC